MKTIKELEQGCEKNNVIWNNRDYTCGSFEDLKHSEHIILCSKCEATLKQTKEIAEMIERMIVASNDTGKELNSESAILTGKDLDIIVRSILNEILSKINGKEKE